jgi:hypothetical protein
MGECITINGINTYSGTGKEIGGTAMSEEIETPPRKYTFTLDRLPAGNCAKAIKLLEQLRAMPAGEPFPFNMDEEISITVSDLAICGFVKCSASPADPPRIMRARLIDDNKNRPTGQN